MLSHFRILIPLMAGIFTQRCDAGQICSSCSAIELKEVCQHHVECNDNETCYIQQYTTESDLNLCDLGCTASQACPRSLESVFGKRAESRHFKCMSCCNDTALCNQNMTCDGTTNKGRSLPKDCSDLAIPSRRSGSYKIYPYGVEHLPVSVYCEFDGNDSWTVFQRRFDGSVNFYRNWKSYKYGFGTSSGEYWLGNDVIHEMTRHGTLVLKIVLWDFNNITKYALYNNFRVAEESQGYRLFVWDYSGTAGDGLYVHDMMMFTTFDRDNDVHSSQNCAQMYKGGWWYAHCHFSNLNGQYLYGHHSTFADGIEWGPWHGYYYSLKASTMMIKRR